MSMYPGTLYDYNAGVYCGVLVTEKVMKRLAKLQQQHLESVTRLLQDNKEEVFPSMWTLHYPEGDQTIVNYIDTSVDVDDRIRTATVANQPRECYPVFIARSMDEARELADARVEKEVTYE